MIPIPTPEEIANEIKMRYGYSLNPFLLVEGTSDVSFFQCRTFIEIENMFPLFGWENVINTITLLQSQGYSNVIAVIDTDYRGVIPATNLPENILLTDSHDIETMMFDSDAFRKVLRQKVSHQKVKVYPNVNDVIRNRILQLGCLIGCIRFYSQLAGQNYSFNGMNIEKFIDRISLSFDRKKFVAHLRGISPKNSAIHDGIIGTASNEVSKRDALKNPFILCCGHDLLDIMAIGLKSLWGTHNSTDISGDSLQELFILGYSNQMFSNTNLFNKMNKWFLDKGYANIWTT